MRLSLVAVVTLVGVGLWGGCVDKKAAKAFNACQWGFKHLWKLDYKLAQDEFESALEIKPNYSGARLGRVIIHEAKSEFDLALVLLGQAMERSPKSGKLMMQRACIHNRMGNTMAAEADEAEARRLEPKIEAAHMCDKGYLQVIQNDPCQIRG